MKASPKKLRGGEWGALVQSEKVVSGEHITVTTKAGKSWDAVVDKVIWTGKGVAIVTTESASSQSTGYGRGECQFCGEDKVPGDNSCWECGASYA